jgi:hypothetical protein
VHRAAGNQHDASGVVQLLGAVSEPILLRFGQLVQRVDDQQEASLLKGVLEPFCGCVGQVFGDGAREVAFFCQQACGEPEGYLNGIEGGAVLELLHCLLGERQHEVACAKCFAAAGRADERGALLVLHTPYKLLPAYLLLLGILAGQLIERRLQLGIGIAGLLFLGFGSLTLGWAAWSLVLWAARFSDQHAQGREEPLVGELLPVEIQGDIGVVQLLDELLQIGAHSFGQLESHAAGLGSRVIRRQQVRLPSSRAFRLGQPRGIAAGDNQLNIEIRDILLIVQRLSAR